MYKKKYHCVIPARAGSKRLKNKNIKNFFGKPIISFPIKAALKSKLFKSVIVSTDSIKIKKICEKFGADVPFIRPNKLSNDYAFPIDVLINTIKKLNIKDDYIFFVYPCNPMLKSEHLINGLKKILSNNANCLFVSQKFSNNPLRSFVKDKKNYFRLNWKNFERKNSQHLKDFYYDTGMFYIYKISNLLKNKKTFPKKTISLEIKKYDTVDINDKEDFEFAKKIFK